MLEFLVRGAVIAAVIVVTLYSIRKFTWPISISIKLLQTDQPTLEQGEREWPGIERQRIRDQNREL